MSANTTPIFAAGYRNGSAQLINALAAKQPRIVWAPSVAGTTVNPMTVGPVTGAANSVVPSSAGSRIHKVTATNTDGANAYVITLCLGYLMTISAGNGNMGAPTITSGTTINRTAGTFTTGDGWAAGYTAAILGNTTLANDVFAIISSLTTTTLVFPGSTFGTNDNPFTGNIYLLQPLCTVNVPLNAGYANGVPAVDLLSATNLPTVFSGSDKFVALGPRDYLIAFSGAQVASGKVVSITAEGADW